MRSLLLRRRARRRVVPAALLLLLGVAACGGGGDTTAPPAPVGLAGRYALRHVAGTPLPAAIFDGVVRDTSGDFHLRLEATDGWLELGADGRYVHGANVAVTIDGRPQPTVHWRDRGVYTRQGDTLQFTSNYIENVAFSGLVGDGAVHVDQNLAGILAGEGESMRYGFYR